MRVRRIILSMDFVVGAVTGLTVYFFSGHWIGNGFAKDLYGVGISVLAIVFSVYFAGLAIIMASSDDEFVQFLEQEGDFTAIVTAFQDALHILFSALIYSIVLYGYTAYRIERHIEHQGKYFLALFAFLFAWGLLGALMATRDSIRYSVLRSRFVLRKVKPDLGSPDQKQTPK